MTFYGNTFAWIASRGGNYRRMTMPSRKGVGSGKDDWMKQTGGGKRPSSPSREKVRKESGNIAEVIREKNRRTQDQSY